MTKADDKRIAAKEVPAKKKQRRHFDETLPQDSEDDLDARDFFQEMKKREF